MILRECENLRVLERRSPVNISVSDSVRVCMRERERERGRNNYQYTQVHRDDSYPARDIAVVHP